jgi:hypothetical protein
MKRASLICLLALLAGTLYDTAAQRRATTAQRLPVIFDAQTMGGAALQGREKLLAPRLAGRANVASATSRPWLDANGWRFLRNPQGKFYYELPAGKATLAAAEAFVYNADALLKIDPADAEEATRMLAFLRQLPATTLPPVADLAVIDDGSPEMGEVLNLLVRRNLLFRLTKTPLPQFHINLKLGTKEFPREAAADPSEFVLRVRRQLTDEARSLRIYGNEVVLGRLFSDGRRARLHLLNYSGREVNSLRVRVRGAYAKGEAVSYGVDKLMLEDFINADRATEFSLSRMGGYTVVDLTPGQYRER